MEHPFTAQHEISALPKSLWAANSAEKPVHISCLCGEKSADIAIIGGGILGLSTALHLAELGQTHVVCLEAAEIGWGASGRNNGQVIAGLKHDPDTVRAKLPQATADALIRCSGQAPELVFSLIKKHTIQCDAVHKGWIQPAPSQRAEKAILSRCKQWQALSAPVEMLDKHQLANRLGTDWYQAAWLDRRGGSVNPLSYTRGLARAAIKAGVTLFTQTPVCHYQQNAAGDWIITTANGSLRAGKLIIATNAYVGALHSQLTKLIIPVRTAQIASEPLANGDWQRLLPQGEAASDASNLLTSFRLTPDKRLVMGGAYATGGDENEKMFMALKQAANHRFPYLSRLQWQYGWSGYLAITPSHLPQITQVAENAYAPIGCNGRGVALSTMTGKQLAQYLVANDSSHCAIPVIRPQPHKLYAFKNFAISANVLFAGLRDKWRW